MFENVINLIGNGQPWAIANDTLQSMVSQLDDFDALSARAGKPLEQTRTVTERNGAAVIPIQGPIFPKENIFLLFFYATAVETLAQDFRLAEESPDVKKIVLDFDSPGGSIAGVSEFAEMIRNSSKPVVSFVGGMAASAAYWIASAADSIVVSDTAMLGNVGVAVTVRKKSDDTLEMISSRAPDKRPDIQTEQGREIIQLNLDKIEDVFLTAVSRNRGVAVDDIAAHRGRLLIGSDAVKSGLADRLGSFESIFKQNEEGTIMNRGQPLALATAEADPVKEFDTWIAKYQSNGMSKGEAIRAAVVNNPTLHAAYLAAYNSAKSNNEQKENINPAIDEWNAAVAARIQAGATRANALREAVKQNPDLHSRYLESVNGV